MIKGLVWGGWLAGLVMLGSTAVGAQANSPSPTASTIATIDLTLPFRTVSPWRFVATQGAMVPDPYFPQETIPAPVRLCLQPGEAAPCDSRLVAMPQPPTPIQYEAWQPHYLNEARIVHPSGRTGRPLLLLQTAGIHSGDGDQAVYTQLLAYDRERDRFHQIYSHQTGHNNNQDIRFIASGPLQGDVISVEPMSHLPYGYWVTVSRLTRSDVYSQALRYRSATIYNDGNPLAVVDSEMPNIEQRLGLWRPGQPLPVPAAGAHSCAKPHLVRMELWCS